MAGKPRANVGRDRAEMLRAAYSVELQDNVLGGIALHGFAKVLRLKSRLRRVEPVLEDRPLRFRPKTAVDALVTGGVESMPPAWSQAV